jgi:hypothetical protein
MKKLLFSLLFISTAASASICVGEHVVANMSDGHYDAEIVELYSDQTALIRYDVDGTTQVIPISMISEPINYESNYSVNQNVVANMSDGHYDAQIIELYSDGTALIRYNVDATTQVVSLTNLSAPLWNESGFNVNDNVVANMSDGHYDAQILELYSDETALIRYNVDATTQVVSISMLAHPITCEGGCR